jgi:4'-phosphopantetheinyl transferase
MKVYWLEQTAADLPAENDWLSASETVCLNAMRFAKRRADWRLGRWAAKRALSAYLDVPAHPQVLKKMEIRPAASGAPEAYFDNQPAAVTISLSHSNAVAACAVAMAGVELGCDLEMVEPRSDAFVADYFTTEEQGLVARASATDRSQLMTLLWSGKESALKALREGLRLDTRSVIVIPGNAAFDCLEWSPMEVRHTGPRVLDHRTFRGWWQYTEGRVRTLVAAPSPNPPICLRVPVYVPDAAFLCA